MTSLSDLARRCGYHVLVEASPTCLEITGDGRWHILERECLRFVKRSEKDHVTIVLRDPLGGRELRDIGEKGVRTAVLSSLACKPHLRPEHLLGVSQKGSRYVAEVSAGAGFVYLGMYDDAISAGMARDKYVIEHGIRSRLNFPLLMETVKADLAGQVVE